MCSRTKEFFIDKGELFLLVMNKVWIRGPEAAEIISETLKRYGIENGRILDTYCGNGRIAINLAKLGYEVYGIDISEGYIMDAKNKAREHGVEDATKFIVGDARELTRFFPPNSFDAVLNIWTSIGYYNDEDDLEMFREAYRVTKEGGIFIIAGCSSRDRLLKTFCPKIFEEFGDLIVLHYNDFSPIKSRLRAKWVYYMRQENGDLKYLGSTNLDLRLYSIHEVVKMLEKAGWEVVEVLENLKERKEAKHDSPINIIARKKRTT